MFIIKPETLNDMLVALQILGSYEVKMRVLTKDPTDFPTVSLFTFVVTDETREGDLQLAEMAFQMYFHQEGFICDLCEEAEMLVPEEERDTTCGHLTFTKVIKPAF